MGKIIYQWIKKNITLLFNAGSLIGTTAVNSGLGFVFWWVAARKFPVEAVGIASASFAAMNLAGTFCILGMGTLLITEIPRKPDQARALISTALLIVGSAGVVAGLGFVIFIPLLAPDLQILRANIVNIIMFVLGVSLTPIVLVLDQALIGLLRGGVQLWRNIFFSVFKLGLLVAFGFLVVQKTGIQIYAAWALANVLSLLALTGAVKPGKRSLRSYLPQWRLARMLGLPALQHHMLNMALQAPTLILPLLVTALLSARSNAWFYIAWQLSNFIFLVPTALTTVLHATNSAHPQSLGQKMRVTIGLTTATSIVANLAIQVFPQVILGFFGARYAQEASWCLRILALAVFPLIIKNHYISVCRIYDRLSSAMRSMIPGGLLELGAAALGAHFGGLTGLSLGWLCAICIEALYMSPTILRVFSSKENSAPEAQAETQSNMEEIWLVDTVMMSAVGTSYVTLEAAWKQTEKMRALKVPPKTPVVQAAQMEEIWLVDTVMMPAVGTSYVTLEAAWKQTEKMRALKVPPKTPVVQAAQQASAKPGPKQSLKPTRLQQYSPLANVHTGHGFLTLPSKSPPDHPLSQGGWQDKQSNPSSTAPTLDT